jgi:urease accessory protein
MVQFLQLMQLSDSAVPIGGAAHSLGLEGLAEWREVEANSLELLIQSFLHEQGLLEACFCRASYAAGEQREQVVSLGRMLSAQKLAKESRDASVVLGRRLLALCSSILPSETRGALSSAFQNADTHHAIVFGYVGALLKFDVEQTAAAFLHQSVSALVSAAQRLMPVGQKQAVNALWLMKEELVNVVKESGTRNYRSVGSFMPLMEVASMRHPRLETRLFLS